MNNPKTQDFKDFFGINYFKNLDISIYTKKNFSLNYFPVY